MENVVVRKIKHSKVNGIYGNYFKFIRFLLRTFTKEYSTSVTKSTEPKVYVCRHLNMHGAITTLKTFNFEVRPLMLGIFFSFKGAFNHFFNYTFTKRYKLPKFLAFLPSIVLALLTVPLTKSVGAIPVYRNSTKAFVTLKQTVKYLLNGESVIIFADKDYTNCSKKEKGELYSGFLYLERLYKNKTGKSITFAPIVINDEKLTVTELNGVTFSDKSDFKNELNSVKNQLENKLYS